MDVIRSGQPNRPDLNPARPAPVAVVDGQDARLFHHDRRAAKGLRQVTRLDAAGRLPLEAREHDQPTGRVEPRADDRHPVLFGRAAAKDEKELAIRRKAHAERMRRHRKPRHPAAVRKIDDVDGAPVTVWDEEAPVRRPDVRLSLDRLVGKRRRNQAQNNKQNDYDYEAAPMANGSKATGRCPPFLWMSPFLNKKNKEMQRQRSVGGRNAAPIRFV